MDSFESIDLGVRMRTEEMDLVEFLKTRDVLEETIKYFVEEKIDSTIVTLMTDEELQKLLPRYGDRIAVLNFCRRSISTKKESLVEKLKKKMDQRNMKDHSIPLKKNRKKTRLIEIGWLCTHSKLGELRQVRARFGGGTRRISVDRDSKCLEILERAKELFFPEGMSTKGSLNEFHVELLDYKSHKCDLDLTIREMYDLAALSTLRFYIATTPKEGSEFNADDDIFIPATTSSNRGENVETTNSPPTRRQSTRLLERQSLSNYYEEFNDEFQFESLFPEILSEGVRNMENKIEVLVLHRGNIFQELLDAFRFHNLMECNFKIEMIMPNGAMEAAEDFGGVFRDVLSEFWSTFYAKCTVGTTLKVPFIRDDFQEDHWKACAKILVPGLKSENYFPIKLAPTFIKKCFNIDVEPKALIDDFLLFVSESERNTLNNCLDNYENVDPDDLLDFLSSYEMTGIPSSENIKERVTDLCHKEIIQKTRFVSECFQKVFVGSITFDEVYTKYETLIPNAKNCLIRLKLFEENVSANQEKTFRFLRKYIKEIDENQRICFLRFCTGSDLPISDITVAFTEQTGVTRSPQAHTCSGLLQLPSTYENYVTFRCEFDNLLSSNIWIMDIV